MAMTKTQQALECLYLKLKYYDDSLAEAELSTIHIHFPDHHIGLLDCLEFLIMEKEWTYCSRVDEKGYILDLEYKRDDILDLLIIDDFTIQSWRGE